MRVISEPKELRRLHAENNRLPLRYYTRSKGRNGALIARYEKIQPDFVFIVAEYCLRLDMSFHNKHKPGELIERIDGDIALLSRFFSEFSVDLIGSLLFAVGVIAMLFHEDWRIGCAFLVYAVLALTVFSGMRNMAILSRR